MICKSSNNSYHDGTSAFFLYFFLERDLHLNAVELVTFLRFPDLPLINCEIEVDLLWTKDCVFIEYHNNIAGVNFMITSTKHYALAVTLSINDNIKFLEKINRKIIVSWSKYRSEIKIQTKK